MNVEELLSSSLRDSAARVDDIPDLYTTAVAKGRRRRAVRRSGMVAGSVVAVAGIVAASLAVAGSAGGSHHVAPADGGQQVVADPWWQTWTPDRYDGNVDPAFLQAVRPTYDGDTSPEPITVYAAGTTTDGLQWAMYTDPREGHRIEWIQGHDNKPVEGEVPGNISPGLTWTSWSFPTPSAEDGTTGNEQWLIVVGHPGTTEIDYSPDGSTWQPLDVHNGIATTFLAAGFPPATAQVRLSDASGVYAQGAPAGAGAGQTDAGSDGNQGTANPVPSPTATETPSTAPGTS